MYVTIERDSGDTVDIPIDADVSRRSGWDAECWGEATLENWRIDGPRDRYKCIEKRISDDDVWEAYEASKRDD